MKHKVILFGEPGSGKSTAGLSYPGVEQHVWGSTEEDTALAFSGRTDILPFVKFNWRDQLKPAELEKFEKPDESIDILTRHKSLLPITNLAKARNIAKYFDYLERLHIDLKAGKRKELQTVFVDNWTSLSEDLWIYTEMLHGDDYTDKTAFKLHQDYQDYCSKVFDLLNALDVHVIVSCHVTMGLDEEMSSKVSFLEQSKVAMKKQWQPYMMGKYKFRLAGKFTFAFFMYCEEDTGKANKYYAKIVADDTNVGVGKCRINPFQDDTKHSGGRKIIVPQYGFYGLLEDSLNNVNKNSKGDKNVV